jgi:lipopolysaccharide/colanic/teichoic acid biosynthesis glycosyltransferase
MRRRTVDATLAAVGLVGASIPLALSVIAIKLTSRGPALYRQVRIGRGGVPMCLYKLRTMKGVAAGSQVTPASDARITAVGRVLRKLKIDELPQLWNVLRGDMGLIGPRPEVPRFVDRYSAAEREILAATPGLASLSQLVYAAEAQALQGQADPDAAYVRYVMPLKIAADLRYERSRTWRSDIRLAVDIALLIVGHNTRIDRQFHIPIERPVATPDATRRDTLAL